MAITLVLSGIFVSFSCFLKVTLGEEIAGGLFSCQRFFYVFLLVYFHERLCFCLCGIWEIKTRIAKTLKSKNRGDAVPSFLMHFFMYLLVCSVFVSVGFVGICLLRFIGKTFYVDFTSFLIKADKRQRFYGSLKTCKITRIYVENDWSVIGGQSVFFPYKSF